MTIDFYELQDYLSQVNILSITLRLALAMIIGGMIGIDRGRKRRPAGLKTHALVCLGAALVMITSQYITVTYEGSGDVARMGAQVISGIGFLGAGTIMITRKSQIKGLTTAAGLWYAACMGLAVGIGFYEGAIIACLFMLIIMKWFNKVEGVIYGKSKIVDLYIELEDASHVSEIITEIRDSQCKIINIEVGKIEIPTLEGASLLVTVLLEDIAMHDEVTVRLEQLSGIRFLEEV